MENKERKDKMKNIGKRVWKEWKQFWRDEDAMGSVEIILIIVVLVGLVLIFRGQVTTLITNAFKQIKGDEAEIDQKNSISGAY